MACLVSDHWFELLRLALSIKTGTVTASVILRKLAAYPRQNGLALALRELGKLERTFFTLQWLQDPELRRRSHVGLNKGEQQNALRRAVFFNRLGELRDRSFENQRYRASGLTLLTAAVVLWNTVYLDRAIRALKQHGRSVDETARQYARIVHRWADRAGLDSSAYGTHSMRRTKVAGALSSVISDPFIS